MNNNSIQTRGIGKGSSFRTTSYGGSLSTKIVVNNNDNNHNHQHRHHYHWEMHTRKDTASPGVGPERQVKFMGPAETL